MKKLNKLILFAAIALMLASADFTAVSAQQTVEDQYWNAVKDSKNADDFKSYLQEYPNGKYAAIARLKTGQNTASNSFLSFKVSTAMTNEAFMERWENEMRTQLPVKIGDYEIFRANAPNKVENYFYTEARMPLSGSRSNIRTQAASLKADLVSDYCKSEASQRKITVVLTFRDNTTTSFSDNLNPNDCSANTGQGNNANQAIVPVSMELSLQSGIQAGANGQNRIPINRNDPAAVQGLLSNPAIYVDVTFSDGTKIGPHDYQKKFADNLIFDDVSGDPNDLIQVSYWDIDSNNPQRGKYAAQLASTGKGTGTAYLKVSLRNAPNVTASVPVTVVSGNTTTATRQTDVQYLNSWAAEVRVGLPQSIGDFQLTDAMSQCPNGCQEQLDPDGGNELALIFKTQRYTAGINKIEEIIPVLKPILLPEYCKQVGNQRNISLVVFVLDKNDRQINNFFVNPKDCSANTTSNTNQNTSKPTNSAQLINAEFLNKWAAEVRVGLPESIAGYQLKTAWSRCPAGCQEKDSPEYLLLKFDTEGEQQYAGIADLKKDLMPSLLQVYCKTEAPRRKIMLGVFFDNRGQQADYNNFWVNPEDCSSN